VALKFNIQSGTQLIFRRQISVCLLLNSGSGPFAVPSCINYFPVQFVNAWWVATRPGAFI